MIGRICSYIFPNYNAPNIHKSISDNAVQVIPPDKCFCCVCYLTRNKCLHVFVNWAAWHTLTTGQTVLQMVPQLTCMPLTSSCHFLEWHAVACMQSPAGAEVWHEMDTHQPVFVHVLTTETCRVLELC